MRSTPNHNGENDFMAPLNDPKTYQNECGRYQTLENFEILENAIIDLIEN